MYLSKMLARQRLFCGSHLISARLFSCQSVRFQDKKDLPTNYDKMIQTAQGREHEFSKYRARDTVDTQCTDVEEAQQKEADVNQAEADLAKHYDNSCNVSLHSVMQSNVPEPYSQSDSPTHLNMPGSGVMQRHKYESGSQNDTKTREYHTYTRTFQASPLLSASRVFPFSQQDELIKRVVQQYTMKMSSSSSQDTSSSSESQPPTESNLSQKERLKRAVKEYGGTVIVFHVAISLMSLGGFYALVSSGIDVVGLMSKIGVGESILQSKAAAGASTFVVAYAVHKVFAPVRIGITLTATPFIVRYLRSIGFLRAKVAKTQG